MDQRPDEGSDTGPGPVVRPPAEDDASVWAPPPTGQDVPKAADAVDPVDPVDPADTVDTQVHHFGADTRVEPAPAAPILPAAPVPYVPPTYLPGPGAAPYVGGPAPGSSDPYGPPPVAPPSPGLPPGAPPAGGSVTPTPRRGWGPVVAVAVVAGLIAGLLGGAGGYLLASRSSRANLSPGLVLPQSSAGLSTRPDDSIAAVAARVTPSVVSIAVTGAGGGGTGSGVVLTADGYIVTNNHVVADAAGGGSIVVTFSSGATAKASIVGRDASYDLAVVKADATGLTPATLGNSSDVQVGDIAIAIGSPLGLRGTVTSGIISALDRAVTTGGRGEETSFISALQTDAAINPGNSGGALLDAQGKVIGINSAIATLSTGEGQSGSIGLGFAIPINQAKRIVEQLISTGHATHPVIGVTLDTDFTGDGARVETVPGGPARDAGVQPGDVIVAVDGTAVANNAELVVAIRKYPNQPGDQVTLTIRRGSDTSDVKVTLGSGEG